MNPLTRSERQQREIAILLVSGDQVRGEALAKEHLVEFPADPVVTRLLAICVRVSGDSAT